MHWCCMHPTSPWRLERFFTAPAHAMIARPQRISRVAQLLQQQAHNRDSVGTLWTLPLHHNGVRHDYGCVDHRHHNLEVVLRVVCHSRRKRVHLDDAGSASRRKLWVRRVTSSSPHAERTPRTRGHGGEKRSRALLLLWRNVRAPHGDGGPDLIDLPPRPERCGCSGCNLSNNHSSAFVLGPAKGWACTRSQSASTAMGAGGFASTRSTTDSTRAILLRNTAASEQCMAQ